MGKRSLSLAKQHLARNVRERRSQLKWSQHDLAAEASLRQGLISAIEVGSANPTFESLEKLATALGLTLSEMFAVPPA